MERQAGQGSLPEPSCLSKASHLTNVPFDLFYPPSKEEENGTLQNGQKECSDLEGQLQGTQWQSHLRTLHRYTTISNIRVRKYSMTRDCAVF